MAGRRSGADRRAFWLGAVERQRESGLSVPRFCRREGLKVATFYWWRRRLEDEGGPAAAVLAGSGDSHSIADDGQTAVVKGSGPQLVPVRLVEEPGREPSWVEVVVPGGFVVRVPESATDHQVRRVLQLVHEIR